MTKKLCIAQDLLDIIYPIGSIYLTINNVNPSTLFGGTWTQLTDDAYLKIVTSNAGQTGGTSNEHKIPVSSLPSHNHNASTILAGWTNSGAAVQWSGSGMGYIANDHPSQGEGKSYYPYYYGVYVWKRTA